MAFWKTVLVLFILAQAAAWNMPVAQQQQQRESPTTTFNRCMFFVKTASSVGAAAVPLLWSATTGVHSAQAAALLTSEAANTQWKAATKTIDDLLENWETIAKGGGDAIRTQLGTQGITSPLFQMDKALKVLRDDAEDIIEFTEMSDEFLLTLSRADSMSYSANFAGGSGKPTPPAVYIENSRKEVLELQKIAKSLSSQLP